MNINAVMVNAADPVAKITDSVTDVLPWVFAFFALELVIGLGMAILDKRIFHGRGEPPPPPPLLPEEDPFDGHDF